MKKQNITFYSPRRNRLKKCLAEAIKATKAERVLMDKLIRTFKKFEKKVVDKKVGISQIENKESS